MLPTPLPSLACLLAHRCSGCDRAYQSRDERLTEYRHLLVSVLSPDEPIDARWIDSGGLRDRVEFLLDAETNVFGMFDRVADRGLARELLDLPGCAQLSPALEAWLQDFRRDRPTIRARGSVRLRVAPDGRRGLWLDFANQDIRDLLDEGTWLQRQLAAGVTVEAGQKRKAVAVANDGPRAVRLIEPQLAPWFETYLPGNDGALKPTPLYSTIGTFTQPGFRANRALVGAVLEHIDALTSQRPSAPPLAVAEFGAGIGNFTLPLLAATAPEAKLTVFESDELALLGLEQGLATAASTFRLDPTRLTVRAGDFIQSARALERSPLDPFDLVLVDPPRPGLGVFLDGIVRATGRADWVYVSCYPDSFVRDVARLRTSGYAVTKLSLIEQFPFTRHFEIVATLQRAN